MYLTSKETISGSSMKVSLILTVIACTFAFGAMDASAQTAQQRFQKMQEEEARLEAEAAERAAAEATARAEAEAKQKADAAKGHCGPRSAEVCWELKQLFEMDESAWKVGAYGVAMCGKSEAIEASRKSRKDRAEYEKRLSEAARAEGRNHDAWSPLESNAAFATRSNQECVSNLEFYCGAMATEAQSIIASNGDTAAKVVSAVCTP